MLTEREKKIIRLRDDEGLSWARIAVTLGTSKGSAHSSYRNAQYKLARAAVDSIRPSDPMEPTGEEATRFIVRLNE